MRPKNKLERKQVKDQKNEHCYNKGANCGYPGSVEFWQDEVQDDKPVFYDRLKEKYISWERPCGSYTIVRKHYKRSGGAAYFKRLSNKKLRKARYLSSSHKSEFKKEYDLWHHFY